MTRAPTEIVIIEDQTIFRELLAEVIGGGGDYSIRQFSDASSGVAACEQLRPALVILDAMLPDRSGLDVLAQLNERRPAPAVLMVTAYARPALVHEAVRLGAKGFVTKSTPLRELVEAVERVAAGGTYFCSATSAILAETVKSPPPRVDLSPRQRQIVQLVARGLSSKAIADELSLSTRTVENHRLHIRQRLNLHDVASFTRFAIEQGLVEPKV
jgi:DNA-binding NarL/FixJ family response regulator